MHDDHQTNLQLLLQQAKANARLHEIQDDMEDLKRAADVIEKERLHAYNTYYTRMDELKRQQDQAHALANEIKKELSAISKQGRKLTTIGLALIFGGSLLSKTELFGLLSKLF